MGKQPDKHPKNKRHERYNTCCCCEKKATKICRACGEYICSDCARTYDGMCSGCFVEYSYSEEWIS